MEDYGEMAQEHAEAMAKAYPLAELTHEHLVWLLRNAYECGYEACDNYQAQREYDEWLEDNL